MSIFSKLFAKSEVTQQDVNNASSRYLFSENMAKMIWSTSYCYSVAFPDTLSNGQQLYKVYEAMSIVPKFTKKNYQNLIIGEPLHFVRDGERVAIFQKNNKIGYINEGKGEKMSKNFLDRNDVIVGFLAMVKEDTQEIRAHIAYYMDKDGRKENYDLNTILNEVKERSFVEIDMDPPNQGTVHLPFVVGEKTLYFLDTKYGICIITTKQPKYKKLKVGEDVSLVKEPKNPADKNAIMILQGKERLGYIYRGAYQDFFNKAISENDPIVAKLIRNSSNEHGKLAMSIGVYKKF